LPRPSFLFQTDPAEKLAGLFGAHLLHLQMRQAALIIEKWRAPFHGRADKRYSRAIDIHAVAARAVIGSINVLRHPAATACLYH